jgi:nicotinamide-nucleotide amidase
MEGALTTAANGAEAETAGFVQSLAAQLRARGWMLATAESCTGGLIAAACTDLAGSSSWFERGFVTYSNAAKAQMLGVEAALIARHGAVSEPVARAMAQGALQHAHAQVALAVTGVAGPGGGSADKPVGTVWFAWAIAGRARDAANHEPGTFAAQAGAKAPGQNPTLHSEVQHFEGDRAAVRQATLLHSLRRLLELLPPPHDGAAAA